MTRAQLRALARKKLGETTSAFWSDDEINTYINDACRDLSFRTKCLRSVALISTTDCTQNTTSAGSAEISLTTINPNIYSVLEAYFHVDGRHWIKLVPTTREELDMDFPSWQDAVGRTYTDPGDGTIYYNYQSYPSTPIRYYHYREENTFGWYPPTDTEQTTSNNIRVFYCYKHADLSGDASEPTIPEPLHQAIIDFVCGTAFETRGWVDRANDSWQKYVGRIQDYMEERHREKEDEDVISRNYRNL